MGMETEVFLRSVRGRLTERMYHVFVGRPASAEVSATPSRTRLPGTDGRLFQKSSMNSSVQFVAACWLCNAAAPTGLIAGVQ
ncbi:unnamed protein product [Musa banksii]